MRIDEVDALVCIITTALNDGVLVVDALEGHFDMLDGASRHAIAAYARGLYAAGRTNIGLSHAKAREYWIYRGPRQLFTTGCFVLVVFLVNECLREQTLRDRVVNASTSLFALLTAFVMLYYRLPDSIRSSVCRSAHDYYVAQKKLLKGSVKKSTGVDQPREASSDVSRLGDSMYEGTDDQSEAEDDGYGIAPPRPSRSRSGGASPRPSATPACNPSSAHAAAKWPVPPSTAPAIKATPAAVKEVVDAAEHQNGDHGAPAQDTVMGLGRADRV